MKCSKCGAEGCKLWSKEGHVRCGPCALEAESLQHKTIDRDGRLDFSWGSTRWIGKYRPLTTDGNDEPDRSWFDLPSYPRKSGGKQPGSGRPTKPVSEDGGAVNIRLSADLLQRLDAARGARSRTEYMVDALIEVLP